MDALTGSIDSHLVLVIAAIAVAFLLARLLFRFLRVGLGPILTIGAIVLGLQYLFGISPDELWGEIANLPQAVMHWLKTLT